MNGTTGQLWNGSDGFIASNTKRNDTAYRLFIRLGRPLTLSGLLLTVIGLTASAGNVVQSSPQKKSSCTLRMDISIYNQLNLSD